MKLKYSIISQLNRLSAKEMDLLLYVLKYSDEATGTTEGVYYLEVMKYTGMCKQSFYNALKGLSAKGIVIAEKGSDIDYNITVPGNAFPNRDSYHEGYVNLNRKTFRGLCFRMLKAHEKYMLFEFLKVTHKNRGSYRKKVQDLYDKYEKALNVTRRVIRGYLHNLKAFFSIGIKGGIFYITYKATVFEPREEGRSEESQHLDFLIRKECHRNHILYNDTQIKDTANLIRQYRQWVDNTDVMVQIVMLCIRNSIQAIQRKDRTLLPAHVHKLVRIALNLE